MELYTRRIVLRNCGRLLHVSSDFGSEYTTHSHLSSEMLYAGLSREQTRVPRAFAPAVKDHYNFFGDFAVANWPIWFTPAVLVDGREQPMAKSRQVADTHQFNSTQEAVPGIQTNAHLPKFGSMETILPDNRFACLALSLRPELLRTFELGQVYWMGKKRTMFQIVTIGELMPLTLAEGSSQTPFLQIRPPDVAQFTRLQVIATTQRYVLLRGTTKGGEFWHLPDTDLSEGVQGLPQFAIEIALDYFNRVEA